MGHVRSPKYSMGDGNLGELERRRKGIEQMESSKGAGRGFGAAPAVRGSSSTFPGIVPLFCDSMAERQQWEGQTTTIPKKVGKVLVLFGEIG